MKLFRKTASQALHLAIELNPHDIRLAESITSTGGRLISRIGYHVFSSNDETKRRSELEFFVLKHGLSGCTVSLSLPRHRTILRFLTLPSAEKSEIDQMAKMEALKQLPYLEEEEVVHGFRIVRKRTDGYSDVFLAMAQKSMVNKLIQSLKQVSVYVEKIALSTESFYLWFVTTQKLSAAETALLINMDSTHMDIDIVKNGELVFMRGVKLTDEDLVNPESVIKQTRTSLLTYQKESQSSVDKLYLCGPKAIIDSQRDLFARSFELPMEILDPLSLQALPPTLEPVSTQQVSWASVIGLALNSDDIQINLAPEEAVRALRLLSFNQELKKTLLAGAAIIFLLAGFAGKMIFDAVALNAYVDSQLGTRSGQPKTMSKVLSDLKAMHAQTNDRPFVVETLREIHALIVPGITLNFLSIEADKALTVRGTSPELASVFKWVNAMERAPIFEEVTLKYLNKRKEGGQDRSDFEITCRLLPAPGESS